MSAAPGQWNVANEQGYVSPAYGDKELATVGIVRSRVQLPAENATLLLPLGSADQPGSFRLSITGEGTAYTYERGPITDSFIFGGSGMAWTSGSLCSDANFLFARSERGELELLIFSAASFVESNGQQVFRSESATGWLQWSKAKGLTASDPKLLKFFDQEMLRNRTAVPLRQ
jgi:hypothetical protein